MDDWVAFLNARLDEVEAAAKALAGETWTAYVRVGGEYNYGIVKAGGEVIAQCGTTHFDDGEARTAHIVLHDPARVLREVEAKRAILGAYETVLGECATMLRDRRPRKYGEHDGLRAAVLNLAAVYSDHPDYRALLALEVE